LYDDDGHTRNAMENGNYELISFEGQQTNKKLLIKIMPANKKVLQSRKFTVELPTGYVIKSATVNAKAANISNQNIEVDYNGKAVTVVVVL
jgi:hypothetical protein